MTATKINVTDEQIKGLLCSALEGGSNYWYMVEKFRLAPGLSYADFQQGGKMQDPKNYWHPYQLIPLVDGCSLEISDMEGENPKKIYRLNKSAIRKGLEVMVEKYPKHFADMISGNDDACTGDVFLQCAVLGDVIYG